MKKTLLSALLLIPFLFLLFSAGYIPAKKAQIGYFYRDSLFRQLPQYKTVTDSLQKNSIMLRSTLAEFKTEVDTKEKLLNSSDTLKWSPVVKQLKRNEFSQLKTRYHDFSGSVLLDSLLLRQRLSASLYDKIDTTAAVYGRTNGFSAIIDRNNQPDYDKWKSEDARLKNVHLALLAEMLK